MRVLMVGGGCRGLRLARALAAEGHAARVVTRDPGARARIEAAGAECWAGDPAVVGTLRYALENVTLLVWALGTARGTPDEVAALHGSRLEMMLERTVDTTARGVVYEAAGTAPAEVLDGGAAVVRAAHERHGIPYRLLDADPSAPQAWVAAAREAMDAVLAPRVAFP